MTELPNMHDEEPLFFCCTELPGSGVLKNWGPDLRLGFEGLKPIHRKSCRGSLTCNIELCYCHRAMLGKFCFCLWPLWF